MMRGQWNEAVEKEMERQKKVEFRMKGRWEVVL